MTAARRSRSPNLFFLRQFVGRPKTVGSVIPTSRSAVKALLDPIDWHKARCIVEFGPGTGVFTRELLRRAGPNTRVIAIDINPVFTQFLQATIRDQRLICVDGSAADIQSIIAEHGFDHADYVISGLPFSTVPHAIANAIMDATADAIRPGGAFLIYQYSLFVMPFLQTRFDQVDCGRVWRCVPPARLFWAWKSPEEATVNRAVRGGSSVAA